jgi:hypothetical protein
MSGVGCRLHIREVSFSMPKKSANPVDRHVGARIRMQRMVRGVSQKDLGNAVGVSFQQVQTRRVLIASVPVGCNGSPKS